MKTTRPLFPLTVLTIVAALFLTGARPVDAANAWERGGYRDFVPPTFRSLGDPAGRVTAPGVKIARTLVQRPRVVPGSAAALIAEYEVSATSPLQVKETRIIRFEGQQVAKLERQVTRPSGVAGSEYTLNVPADAAPGWYTVTTMVEPVMATRTLTRSARDEQASSAFYVDERGAVSAPAAGAPAAPAPAASAPPAAPPAGGVSIRLWSEKTKYKVGEAVKLNFQSNGDGYVTLVNVGTSGKVTILYPNAYAPSHAVKRGQTYSLPGADDPYTLTLGGPEGVELVYALFTTRPTRFVEDSFTTQPFTQLNERVDVVTRDINVAVKKIPLKEQAKAVLEIEVTP